MIGRELRARPARGSGHRRRAAREAGWLAVFAAAGVVATWPRAAYLAGRLPSSRDSATYVWGFWWVARQLTHLHDPWFTSHLAAPAGVQLGFHAVMPLPGVLLAPVTRAFGPAVSYNLLAAVMPGLLCYAMYRAARLWLRSGVAAAVAGAFFGLSAMLTEQDWYHLNIAAGALFLPLALEASVRLGRTPGRRQAAGLGLVMGAAALTDQESSLLAATVTGLVLLPWLLRQPSSRKFWPAALALAVAAVAASPQIIAMIAEIRAGGLAIPPGKLAESYKQYGIGLPGMFTRRHAWPASACGPSRPRSCTGATTRECPCSAPCSPSSPCWAWWPRGAATAHGCWRHSGPAAPHSHSARRCGSASTSTCRWRPGGMACGCPTSCLTPGSSVSRACPASARRTGWRSSG